MGMRMPAVRGRVQAREERCGQGPGVPLLPSLNSVRAQEEGSKQNNFEQRGKTEGAQT